MYEQLARSLETSVEIIEALVKVVGEDGLMEAWEAPTDEEYLAVWEIVAKNGMIPADNFCWGAAGSYWEMNF